VLYALASFSVRYALYRSFVLPPFVFCVLVKLLNSNNYRYGMRNRIRGLRFINLSRWSQGHKYLTISMRVYRPMLNNRAVFGDVPFSL